MGSMTPVPNDVLTSLLFAPGQFEPVRPLHQSAACHVWLVLRAGDPPGVLRIPRTAAASRDLRREAAWLRQLQHPAVPRVLADFESPQGCCLITTAFDGLSLRSLLQRTGRPLPAGLALAWAEEVCAVLDYLHNGPLPLVHSDLHPGHLVLQIAPAGGRVGSLGLIDFGAARRLDHAGGDGSDSADTASTDSLPRLGHPEYAAPEQLLASPGPPDPRTDVYGLAATVYRLITGHGPVRLFEFAPAQTIHADVPVAVATVLQRALSPDPADRFASARAFAEAIADVRRSLHPFAGPARPALAPLLAAVELSAEERAALQAPLAENSPAPAARPEVRPAADAAKAHSSPAVMVSAAAAPAHVPPADADRLPSRRRQRRRAIGLAWLLVPVVTGAGVWAALHFSGMM